MLAIYMKVLKEVMIIIVVQHAQLGPSPYSQAFCEKDQTSKMHSKVKIVPYLAHFHEEIYSIPFSSNAVCLIIHKYVFI